MFKSEKCFKGLEIREMPMKTTLKFHIAPVRIAKINKTTGKKWLVRSWEKGALIHC